MLDASSSAYVRRDGGGVLFLDGIKDIPTALLHPTGFLAVVSVWEENLRAKELLNRMLEERGLNTRIG